MSTVRAKAFTCGNCQKLIAYSPGQAGTTIQCPRCGVDVALPQGEGLPPPLPTAHRRKRRGRSCLLWGLGGCLFTLLFLVGVGILLGTAPFLFPNQFQRLLAPLASQGLVPAVAPAAASLPNSDISIAVTKMVRDRPEIFIAALKRISNTETPVYCVTVQITNGGTDMVSYRTWRNLADARDKERAATLVDEEGRAHGTVSFGPDTWPVGTRPRAEIRPGESHTDILLFQCGEEPPGDFLLTLPGANLGRGGTLRFRIPRELTEKQPQDQ